MKNNKIYIYIFIYLYILTKQRRKNNIRIAHISTRIKKKKIGVCITFIVFMIKLAKIEFKLDLLEI